MRDGIGPAANGVSVKLSDGGVLKVRTQNWSPSNVYVKAVYLNGVRLKGTTLRYEDIRDGGDLLFVMKFTGHCDYKSMRPYIDITESAKKDAIKKMEEAFKKK